MFLSGYRPQRNRNLLWRLVIILVIFGSHGFFVILNGSLIDHFRDVKTHPLPEQGQQTWIKWSFLLIPRKPDKVLEIRILRDLLNQLTV